MNVSLVEASGTVTHLVELHDGVELVRNGQPLTGRYLEVSWSWSHQAFRWALVSWRVGRSIGGVHVAGKNWSDLPEVLHQVVKDTRPVSLTR